MKLDENTWVVEPTNTPITITLPAPTGPIGAPGTVISIHARKRDGSPSHAVKIVGEGLRMQIEKGESATLQVTTKPGHSKRSKRRALRQRLRWVAR